MIRGKKETTMSYELLLNSYYFHSIRMNLETLKEIFESGAILSRKQIGKTFSRSVGFNGTTRISLCKYIDQRHILDRGMRSAYHELIKHSVSIVLDGDIPAKKTYFCYRDTLNNKDYQEMIADTNETRYSDCLDEYQCQEPISVSHFVAIGYPITERMNEDKEVTKEELTYLKKILDTYQTSLPILDSTNHFEEELIKRKKK